MAKKLFTFVNIHALIKAERLLKEKGLSVELIPTPKTISSECGMSLLVDECIVDKVQEVLGKAGVEVTGLYEYSRD